MARDPMEAFADMRISADVKLSEGQLRALGRHVERHAEDEYSTTIGLADIGEGYLKLIFYDRNTGVQIHQELIFAEY